MEETWSKFHERYGSKARSKPIRGGFIIDPQQYEANKKNTAAMKRSSSFFITCLSCLCGGRGAISVSSNHQTHHREGTNDTDIL